MTDRTAQSGAAEPTPPVSDRELVSRARRGDSASLHALADRYADAMYAMARSLVGNAADAEDVVQETVIGMIRGVAKFQERASFKTWLFGILIRQAARQRKQRSRRQMASLPEEAPARRAAHAELSMDVESALQTLSDEHRQVIVLRELQGMSYSEMAAALSVPLGTIESRLHRARQELKQRLSAYRA